MNTLELVERCIKRDRPAWDEFVRKYEGLVRRAVYYKLNRMNAKSLRSEADDIVQEVLLMLWSDNKLAMLRDVSSLEGWLVITAINRTTTYCNRRWKETRLTKSFDGSLSDDEFTLADTIPAKGNDPAKALYVKELADRAGKEISNLNMRERRALKLSLDGRRHTDIANVMGMSANTVSTLVRRAKSKVRQGMSEYCIS
jgi:RNA polymerase sigma factor (sigma-70 family)